jgi:hypothetical protein
MLGALKLKFVATCDLCVDDYHVHRSSGCTLSLTHLSPAVSRTQSLLSNIMMALVLCLQADLMAACGMLGNHWEATAGAEVAG